MTVSYIISDFKASRAAEENYSANNLLLLGIRVLPRSAITLVLCLHQLTYSGGGLEGVPRYGYLLDNL